MDKRLSLLPVQLGYNPADAAAQMLDLLERAAKAGAWAVDLPARRFTWTAQLATLLGIAPAAVPSFEDALAFYAPESRVLMAGAFEACMEHGTPFDEEAQVIAAGGRLLWMRSLGEALRDTSGRVVRIQGILHDLTDKKSAEQDSLRLTMRLSTTLASITDAFATLDMEGRFTYVNPESERLLRRKSRDLLGQTLWQAVHANRGGRLRRELSRALANGQPVEFEEFYAEFGKWLELRAYPFEEGLAVYFRDITERKAAKDEIEHLAFYDALTQLPNRQLLMDRLQSSLASGSGHSRIGALMFIDLDHFKVLNDTLGHAKGDLLLQKVASRLQACVRHNDTVARLGGDEFVVLLEDQGEKSATAIAGTRVVGEKILAALSEPYDLAGHEHHATCSIGITFFSQQQESIGDLLKQADLAMYGAKAASRNTLCFFDPQMQAAATANAATNVQLRQGLRNREFLLHYQPQVGSQGHMVGVEALVRWRHPQRGLVPPDAFISQAEESGLILPLGKWVLETACAQLAAWAGRAETASLSIAVNVSVRQFRHPDFVELVMAAISEAGISAHRLKLELTESLLASNIEVTIAKMGILKRAGVTLSIDDFGMGYSALSYLKHLPLDQLKIDRSFVKDVLTDPNDAAIARTIIGLAQSLGLGVMAEGVETEAQREFLARHGCGCYQGYLFCKALPIGELESFMLGKRM
ncbi:putative bifunctional diguanylate cyclase/phosphodiesterase [Polaromonas sp. CT11-55]|uniref:putative bifunctional diguanylate cyclase/phosphodiesterase n=1 Tax=Polaromonas sp. CT11-55 TaxID=3243045 RepID=UPI0039A6E5E7